MKKIEIERMQRLEEMIASRDQEIQNLVQANKTLSTSLTKLEGANEALTELIVRLKKGE